jgi:hypothetical protein
MPDLPLLDRLLLFYGNSLPNHPRKWWIHAHLRRLLQVSIDLDIDVIRKGIQWTLNPRDFVHQSLFWLGEMDTWETYHLQALLSPGAVFYDVGSNFGYYSLYLAYRLEKMPRSRI